ncbi:MAG: DoxX family protein [Myxococcota bacterium]
MRWLTWPGLESWAGIGTAVARVALGLVMVMHGWGKVAGGARAWTALGSSGMAPLGLGDVAPTAFGATASFIEFFGGLLVVVGFATRPVSFLMTLVLGVATTMHLTRDGLDAALHPIAVMAAFVLLMFVGPGSFSIDSRLSR